MLTPTFVFRHKTSVPTHAGPSALFTNVPKVVLIAALATASLPAVGYGAIGGEEWTPTDTYVAVGLTACIIAYWLATDVLVEKDPKYIELKKEVKKNEAAGEGKIETQIQKWLNEVREANGEAEAWESMNAQLAARLAAANAAVAFWTNLVDEDRRFLEEKEREDAERKARLAAAPAYGGGPTVYITATGSKYHRAGCRYLRKSAYPISKADARASGYSP